MVGAGGREDGLGGTGPGGSVGLHRGRPGGQAADPTANGGGGDCQGSLELRFGEGNRFEQIESVGEQAATRSEGAARSGAYTYEKTAPHMGTVSLAYDDGASCEIRLSFTETGAGTFSL